MDGRRSIKKAERRVTARRRKTGKRELAKHARRAGRAPREAAA